VNGNEWVLEISVHNEVRIWQPDVVVVVECVEELEFTLVGVLEAWVKPLLLQKELHFIFLQNNKDMIMVMDHQIKVTNRQRVGQF
jgi:hypothetical protein